MKRILRTAKSFIFTEDFLSAKNATLSARYLYASLAKLMVIIYYQKFSFSLSFSLISVSSHLSKVMHVISLHEQHHHIRSRLHFHKSFCFLSDEKWVARDCLICSRQEKISRSSENMLKSIILILSIIQVVQCLSIRSNSRWPFLLPPHYSRVVKDKMTLNSGRKSVSVEGLSFSTCDMQGFACIFSLVESPQWTSSTELWHRIRQRESVTRSEDLW